MGSSFRHLRSGNDLAVAAQGERKASTVEGYQPERHNEVSTYEDQTITCVDCKEDFTFSAGEQEFFREKGLNDTPKRCKECRQAKRARNAERSGVKLWPKS